MENREIIRLWRVYKTVHEMVSDRGYLVAKSELEMSLEDFKQTYTTAGVIEYILLIPVAKNLHFLYSTPIRMILC
jgi:hypothetical protein